MDTEDLPGQIAIITIIVMVIAIIPVFFGLDHALGIIGLVVLIIGVIVLISLGVIVLSKGEKKQYFESYQVSSSDLSKLHALIDEGKLPERIKERLRRKYREELNYAMESGKEYHSKKRILADVKRDLIREILREEEYNRGDYKREQDNSSINTYNEANTEISDKRKAFEKKVEFYAELFNSNEDFILFKFNPKKYVKSSYIRDKVHANLIEIMLNSKIASEFPNKLSEYHFDHYKLSGYIDILLWDDDLPLIFIIEVKSGIYDMGYTIRQIHKYETYFTKGVDSNFQFFSEYMV